MNHGVRKEFLDGTRRHGNYRLPIQNFLRSRLGRPWSEIHSEMSQEFDRRTYAGYRFWKTLLYPWGYVETDCWIGAETGTAYDSKDERIEGFYVHPFTGLLSFQGPEVKPEHKLPESPNRIVIEHHVIKKAEKYYESDVFWGRAYEKINGIWYYTHYKDNPYYVRYPVFPNETNSKPYSLISQFTRQLNKKELKRLGVSNNTPDEIRQILEEIKRKEKERRDKHKAWMEQNAQ